MKKINTGILLLFMIIALGIKCLAQDDNRALLKKVIHENEDAVNAIAMYPTETRKIIFEASEYPEVITKLNAMQKNTEDTFAKLISSFSKEEQERIWDLTRYDGLISDLAADHKKSKGEINNILVNYPEEIHKTALEEGINNYDLLVQIDKMNTIYSSDFELLINSYPPEAVNAFREIIKLPEVLEILFNHMQYTVVIGDYYKKNPERVLHKTDSLNQVLTQKNTKEANDWKQSVNDNPQAQQEYTQAAQEYAQANGYQPEDYNASLTPDVMNYSTNPYNWWFGYPSWYQYDYWNPYPYWYDWGFYYGPGRQMVFFGLPSAHFMDWYFYNPEHFYKYPELSNQYYNYYTLHRESMGYNPISSTVNNWSNRNKGIVTDAWNKDNANRTERFKEYGQMEMARTKYNTKHPQRQVEQTEFVQKKQNRYQLLSADIPKKQAAQNESNTRTARGNNTEPVMKPTVTIPDRFKTKTNEQTNNNKTAENLQQHKTNVQKQNNTEKNNQIRNAQQYHQNMWQQSTPQRQPQQQENRQVQQPVRQNTQAPANNSNNSKRR